MWTIRWQIPDNSSRVINMFYDFLDMMCRVVICLKKKAQANEFIISRALLICPTIIRTRNSEVPWDDGLLNLHN